jgi:hypothetical protein
MNREMTMKTLHPLRLLPTLAGALLLGTVAASHAVVGEAGFGIKAGDADSRPALLNRPEKGQLAKPTSTGLGRQTPALTPPESRISGKADAKVSAARSPNKLFDMEDRAIIIVGGKQTTAGAVKQAINAEITRLAGPPKTVKGGARKLDLGVVNVASSAKRLEPAPPRTMGGPMKSGGAKFTADSTAASISPSSWQAARTLPSTALKDAVSSRSGAKSIADGKCLDNGPPIISEVQGRLKPGTKVTVWGRCFGDRPGRVEIIGQFPGGKLTPAFTAWDMTGIEIEIPAHIRGAMDHAVAVTIVTAGGHTTPAMQAQFVAARERVEVPDRLWSPSAGFELSATVETLNTATGALRNNDARAGQVSKSLRVHPQCGLDTMDAIVLSGGIRAIRGWELGPPNEAAVTIDWEGTCTGSKTTTSYNYVLPQVSDDVSISSACRVAFQARAWAYCPVGVAP